MLLWYRRIHMFLIKQINVITELLEYIYYL